MKNLLVFSTLLLCTCISLAQDRPQTLFGNKGQSVSGFGGFKLGFTNLGDDFVTTAGGGGGILVDNSFFFGGYGTGLSSELDYIYEDGVNSMKYNTSYGHGGLWSGIVIRPVDVIHFGASVKVGWGTLSVNANDPLPNTTFPEEVSDSFFLVIPQGEVEVNMTEWLKINFGVGYQFVNGVDNYFYESRDMSDMSYELSFHFGWFR